MCRYSVDNVETCLDGLLGLEDDVEILLQQLGVGKVCGVVGRVRSANTGETGLFVLYQIMNGLRQGVFSFIHLKEKVVCLRKTDYLPSPR